MKEVVRLIQFAIENKLARWGIQVTSAEPYWTENYNWFILTWEPWWVYHRNTIELIMQKDFIEALAKGLMKKSDKNWWFYIQFPCGTCTYTNWWDLQEIINDITYYQAIAIRDNTLDTYITKLLWKNDI